MIGSPGYLIYGAPNALLIQHLILPKLLRVNHLRHFVNHLRQHSLSKWLTESSQKGKLSYIGKNLFLFKER